MIFFKLQEGFELINYDKSLFITIPNYLKWYSHFSDHNRIVMDTNT